MTTRRPLTEPERRRRNLLRFNLGAVIFAGVMFGFDFLTPGVWRWLPTIQALIFVFLLWQRWRINRFSPLCRQCGHYIELHLLVKHESDPVGVMLCSEEQCQCTGSWAFSATPAPGIRND